MGDPQRTNLALPGLSLFAFLALILGGGFMCIGRYLLPAFGGSSNEQPGGWGLICILTGVILLGLILVYASVITWLLFAKIFFTRSQVEGIANYGPTTRFDRWLINRFFPR